MKIAHLIANEKFTDLAARQFEEAQPNSNTFFIFCDEKINERAQFALAHCNATQVHSKQPLKLLSESLVDFDLIVFHSLYYKCARVAFLLPPEKKCLWLFWGSEVYNDVNAADRDSCGPLTAAKWRYSTFQVVSRNLKKCWDRIASLFNTTVQKKLRPDELVKIAQRMDYIGSFVDEDVARIRIYLEFQAQPFWFSYSDIEHITVGSTKKIARGNNIFLGNSATYSNNHLEVFNILQTLNLTGKKVICPLSYGDSAYRSFIIASGENSLGSSFSPLNEFMTLEQYNAVLLGCSVAIMGHYRQQAVTNIISLLWFGCKVYLSDKNPCYAYFKRIGIILFSIEAHLTKANLNWDQPLESSAIEKNKQILSSELCHENSVKKLRASLQNVFNTPAQ